MVLSIDPGRRQAKTIDRLTRDFQEHEVIVVESGDQALETFESRLPDLLVFPLFIAPGDESRMEARLQQLADPDDHQTLSIPLRAFFAGEAQAARPAPVPPRWFYWFRPRSLDDAASTQVQVFVEALRADLDRPRPIATPVPMGEECTAANAFAAPWSESEMAAASPLPFSGEAGIEAEVLPPEPRQELVLSRPVLVVDVRRPSLLSSSWKLPRGVRVGVPAAAIMLTLGVSGSVRELFSPQGWMMAVRERWSAARPQPAIAEPQNDPGSAGSSRVEAIERASAGRQVGALHVDSDPPGASVSIDGELRGVTPLDVGGLAAGRHAVDITLNGNIVRETAHVAAGKTSNVRTSIYRGWLALFSAIELELAVGGRPLTLDDKNRVMLPSGWHQLTMRNRALDYSATQNIEIKPGATTPFSVELPKTTLTVTTSSPAYISIDGDSVGTSPLAAIPVEIGTRQITARSPEQGERHATVTATTAPVSVTIDFAAP